MGRVCGNSSRGDYCCGAVLCPTRMDQTLQCDTQATCPRFIVLSNFTDTILDPNHHKIIVPDEAVLDRETGLVWEQSPAIRLETWEDAQLNCNTLATGGRLGWRLHTIQELASPVDPNVSTGPTLPAGHPFSNVQSSSYWSASTSAVNTARAWGVNFSNGGVGVSDMGNALNMWCVRGGSGVDPHPVQ